MKVKAANAVCDQDITGHGSDSLGLGRLTELQRSWHLQPFTVGLILQSNEGISKAPLYFGG